MVEHIQIEPPRPTISTATLVGVSCHFEISAPNDTSLFRFTGAIL